MLRKIIDALDPPRTTTMPLKSTEQCACRTVDIGDAELHVVDEMLTTSQLASNDGDDPPVTINVEASDEVGEALVKPRAAAMLDADLQIWAVLLSRSSVSHDLTKDNELCPPHATSLTLLTTHMAGYKARMLIILGSEIHAGCACDELYINTELT